jgi:DNA topoisomerase-1
MPTRGMPASHAPTRSNRVIRLRRVSPTDSGWTRRRQGRGFQYLDQFGAPLPAEHVARCKALVIPPAWTAVWICPYANGHIQCVGTDARGRRQYLYHPDWRIRRDLAKHDRVLAMAQRLPGAREQVEADLCRDGMPIERALATAFRLLDLGYFRIGSDSYTDENGSYGLTTLEREHVHRKAGRLVFEFTAKSGKDQHIEIADAAVLASVETMRRRRGGGTSLLAYRSGRTWSRVTATEVNSYLKGLLADEVSAKDFRTWHGTVHAAVALAELPATSKTGRKKAIVEATRRVAEYLGNTPTIARASYIDDRIIELYQQGKTIRPAMARLDPDDPNLQTALERAVIRLLRNG